ncbi:hypothetical protein HDC34_002548 [Pseudoclavibacter sp. JAI123]|nr:hypothetical protein [Pseudoclavibacter sp. JAI123]
MIERLDGVVSLYSDSSTLYEALVEPITLWAASSLGPRFIMDPESADGRRARELFDEIGAFHERNLHRKRE